MTRRPIALNEVGVIEAVRDGRIWPARVRSGNRIWFGERGIPPPYGIRGDIVGAVGGAGQVGRHGIPRESTYSYFVTSSKPGGKQGSVTRSVSNQLPEPTSPSVTPPAGAGVAPSVAMAH
jgi:hypothetical protein